MDAEFRLRVLFGLFGLLVGVFIFVTTEPRDYLHFPAVVVIVGSILAVLSAFIPWLRQRRRG